MITATVAAASLVNDYVGQVAHRKVLGAEATLLNIEAERLSGGRTSLEQYRGAPVLVNVWATWCKPCRDEMPSLERLTHLPEARNLRVVGISIDQGNTEAVRAFSRTTGITFDIWVDVNRQLHRRLGSPGIPLTLVLDRKGVVRHRAFGARIWDDPRTIAEIDPWIK